MSNNYVYRKPQDALFEYAKTIKTPAVIYELNQLNDTIDAIQQDIALFKQAKLNFALKACHNMSVLQLMARKNLGCDVASVNEYKIAVEAGFSEITTTAPAYEEEDMRFFHENNIIMDLDSIEQIEQYGKLFPGSEIGIRVHVEMPNQYNNDASFGNNSRFGMNVTDEGIRTVSQKYGLKIVRLHVHTGQMTDDSLEYKIKYLLTVAEFYSDVNAIDLGGGFFYLYNARETFQNALLRATDYVDEWEKTTGRSIHFIFEPGGAIVTPCGYLVAKVMSVKESSFYEHRIATVNASAWNLAPWHNAVAVKVNKEDGEEIEPTIIAGNTLYELDFFGNRNDKPFNLFELGKLSANDRLIISMFGGYTFTNARHFNALEWPEEYTLLNGELKECRIGGENGKL